MQSNAAPVTGKSRGYSPVMTRTSRLIRRVFLMGSTALAGIPVVGVVGDAAANPQGGVVVGGAISIQQTSPTQLDVVQSSQRGIIDWRSFSIGANETTNFVQPLGGVTLNRVVGDQASQILGRLTATGTIFLVNQNGIVFGSGAQVDVGGLVATTANISNNNFMAGLFKFDQAGSLRTASVVNQGEITVRDAGLAAFVAPGVENAGVIEAKLGRVVLGGAETFAVDLMGDGLLSFSLGAPVQARPNGAGGQPMESLASNSGTIKADGGTVVIGARQAVKVVENVVNMSGRIEATSVEMRNGTVVLSGGDTGRVAVSGQIDASGKQAGETGGNVQVLGDVVALQAGAAIDVSGQAGGGTALVGGDWQGGGTTQRATTATMASGATISADALSSGDGGTVVVWADRDTRFDGSITARGGSAGGNGGKVETSGKRDLYVGNNAKVDATAPKGTTGKWLLDPLNVIIGSVTTAGFLDGGDPNTYVPTATGATVSASAILAALNSGVDVEVTTGTTGAEAGNITVATALSWSSARQLKLSAAGAIDIQAPITAAAGALAMEAQGGSITQTAGGTINVDRLSAKSAGAITLNQANNVNTLQLLSGNDDVVLIDMGGGLVAVGDIYSCFGTATVSTTGNLTAARVLGQVANLTATGNITLTGNVESPMGTLTLSAGGNISQTGGVITIRTLTGSAGGTSSLTGANLITNLGTFASTGGLSVTNAQTLTVTGAVSSMGTVNLTATAGNVVNTLTTGTINGNIVALTASAGQVQVNEDVTASDTIRLVGSTAVTQSSGGILNANALYAESAGSVSLTQSNLVGALAGKITSGGGSFLFTNANSFSVNTVSGNPGVSTQGGFIRLTALAGTLSVGQAITSDGGNVELVANNMSITAMIDTFGDDSFTSVLLRPSSGLVIDLGGADTSSRLGITNAEANNIFADILQIGTTGGANIEVTAPITLTSTSNLYLATAGTVVQSTGAALTVDGLRLDVTRNAPSVLSDLNDVNRLSGQQTSNCFSSFCSATFSFTDIDGFEIASVAGSNGLFYSTFAAVSLTATTGAITVSSQIQGGQNLTLTADNMAINNTVSGTNNMTVRPVTTGTTVDLGGADGAGVLGLDATELTRFSTPNLTIGTNAAGPIVVSSAVTVSGSVSGTLTLQTLDDITFNANFTRTGNGSLQLTADEISIANTAVVDTARSLFVNARDLTVGGNLDVGTFTSDLASIALTGAFAVQGSTTFSSAGDISVQAATIAAGGSTTGFNISFTADTSFANSGTVTASGGFLTIVAPTLDIGASLTANTIRLEVVGNGLVIGGTAGVGETDITALEFGSINADNIQFGGTQTGAIRLLLSIAGDSLGISSIAFVSTGSFTSTSASLTGFQTIGFAVENFVISGTAFVGGDTIEFQQINSGTIDIGGVDGAGTLGISNAEFGQMSFLNLRFGRSTLNDAGTLVGTVLVNRNTEVFSSDFSFIEINATSLTTNNNLGADLALFINADEINFGAAPVYADYVRIAPYTRGTVQIGGTGTGNELLLTTASLNRVQAEELQIGTSQFDTGFEVFGGVTGSIVIADAAGIVSPRIDALLLAAGSGGSITQTGAIVVDKLLIVEAGSATLDNAGNQVGILAAGLVDGGGTRTIVSDLTFVSQGTLTIGNVAYVGIGDITGTTGLVGRGLNAGCTNCNLSAMLVTDAIAINEAIDVGFGSLGIVQRTAGTDIAIGGADASGVLGIDATELGRITSVRFLSIGDGDTGNISVTTSFSLNTLSCCSLGSLQFTGAGDFSTTAALAAGGRNLTVSAANITIGDDAADTLSTSTLTTGFSFVRPTTSLNATGTVTANAPIQSSGSLSVTSGDAASFTQTIQTESGGITVTAGGAVSLAAVTVGSGSASITADGLLTVGGAMSATSSIRLTATDFAINANVTAPSLRLDAPATAISVGGAGTLSTAELARLFGSSLVQIGDENTGNLTLASAISGSTFGAVGNLALISGGTLDLDGNTVTSTATLALTAAAMTIDGAVTANVLEIQHVSGGDLALGAADSSGTLGLQAAELAQLSSPTMRFGRNSIGSRAGTAPGLVIVSSALANSGGSIEINAASFINSAALTASTNLFINANTLLIGAALNADMTTGTVRIAPRNSAFSVDIGGAGGIGGQIFTQSTLDLISANTLEIGALNTSTFGTATTVGNVVFSAATDITTVNQLFLVQSTSSFPTLTVTQTAPVTVNALAIRGSSGITLLNAGNNVGSFAASTGVFGSAIRFANSDGFTVAALSDGLGGTINGVQSTSVGFGQADVVRLSALTGDITLGAVVSATGSGEVRLLATQGRVVQNAGATVTARTLELDLRDSTVMTEANSVQFLAARLTGASQNFSFTANSTVGTTTGSGGIAGVTVPGNLVLRSNFGNINSTAAPFNITGTSRFEAPSGSVTLTNLSNVFGGLLSFQGFSVNVAAASGIALDTVNLTGSLTLNANGGITQAGAMVVNGSSSLTATNADIVLTNTGNRFGGTVTVTTANNVSLVGTNGFVLGNMTIANDLSVQALTGGINATGALVIGGDTTFRVDTAGNAVTANNAANAFSGLISVLGSASNVTLRDSTTIELGMVNASGNLVLNGPAMRGSDVLTIGGTTTVDPNCGCVSFTNAANTFGGLFTTAVALDFEVQAATPINLANTQTLGDFTLANQGFTFGGTLTIDGRALRLRTAGTTLTILPGAVITVAGGSDIVIEADFLSLGAPINGPSTANLTIMPVSATQTIGVGTGASGSLSIDNAELAFVEGRFRSITFGRPGQTGAIDVAGGTFGQPVTFRSNGPGGSISVNGMLVGTGLGGFTFRGSGTTTHLFADIVTAGAPILIDDSVILHTSVTLDTTNGGGVPAGANITITGTTDGNGGGEGLTAMSGAGAINLAGALGSTTRLGSVNLIGGSISVASINALSIFLDGSTSLTGTSYRTNGGTFETAGAVTASSLTIDVTDPDGPGDVIFGGSFSAASLSLVLGSGNASGSSVSLGALSVSGLGGTADFTGTLNGRSGEVAARFVVRPEGADDHYVFNTCIMSTACGSLITDVPIEVSGPMDPGRFDPGGIYDGGGFYGGGGDGDGPIGPGRPFISLIGMVVPAFEPKPDETTVQFSNQGNDELW